MVQIAEINQTPPHYSISQHIGRVATSKLVPRKYLNERRRIGLRIYVRYCLKNK